MIFSCSFLILFLPQASFPTTTDHSMPVSFPTLLFYKFSLSQP